MRSDCEICGGQEPLHLNETRGGVDIVACRGCGLVWNYAMQEEAAQVTFYKEENRACNQLSRGKLVSRLSRAACVLDFLDESLKPGMRHLDVGCAEGTLLTLTRARGLKVKGLEVDSHWSCFAREVRHLEVLPMTLENSPLEHKSFDLLSFVHVVEHLPEPTRTLQIAHQLLDDKGCLYIEVPNLAQPLPGLRRFFRSLHNFYFTANTLRALVTKAGFVPLRLGCSRRDFSLQLIAIKCEDSEQPWGGENHGIVEKDNSILANSRAASSLRSHSTSAQSESALAWRDDAQEIYQHVNGDRNRYYLMFYLLRRWLRQQDLKRWSVARYGDLLPELEDCK